MEIVVREGTEADFPVVLELIKGMAEFEKQPDAVINTVGKMNAEKEYFGFFVAEDEGEVIGFALYFYCYFTFVGKCLWLDDIYVESEYRGQGVGKRLMKKVFELAKDEGCQRLRWQVLDWNEPAIQMYKKMGAEITGEWLDCKFTPDTIEAFLND